MSDHARKRLTRRKNSLRSTHRFSRSFYQLCTRHSPPPETVVVLDQPSSGDHVSHRRSACVIFSFIQSVTLKPSSSPHLSPAGVVFDFLSEVLTPLDLSYPVAPALGSGTRLVVYSQFSRKRSIPGGRCPPSPGQKASISPGPGRFFKVSDCEGVPPPAAVHHPQ